MLQSRGLQRVRHDLKTEQQQQHHLYVKSKKIQLVNITKKRRRSRFIDTENKPVVIIVEENQLGVGQWKVQIIGYELGYKNILYNTGNTANSLQ